LKRSFALHQERRIMAKTGWLVAERCYRDGGSRFFEIPLSLRLESREAAEADSVNFEPKHGGTIFVVPYDREERKPPRLRRDRRRN